MEKFSIGVRVFLFVLTAFASMVLIWNIINMDWSFTLLTNLLVFVILSIMCESLPVALPKGGYVTVGFAVFMAAMILFPLGVTLIVVALSCLIVLGKAALGQPFYKRVFNASQYVLSLAAAYELMSIFAPFSFQLNFQFLIVYMMAAAVFTVVNMTIVTIILALTTHKSPWSIWVVNFRWALPNFLALAPLGLLLALLYKNLGSLGLCLLVIPLLISRHSFQLYIDMRENYLNTVEALVQALEAKDTYTSGHSERVVKLAVAIAEEIGMSEEKIEALKYAAVLHDVGKIGVSETILNKKEKLLDSEWDAIRSHPVVGQTIIKRIKFLLDIGTVVRHHHERYDGNGYPDGIKGEEISLESRIIAVADTYDAITSDRSYRKGLSHDEAVVELRNVAGTQLDPQLVEAFCKVVTRELAEQTVSIVQEKKHLNLEDVLRG